MRSMSKAELVVVNDLRRGKLDSLGEMLSDESVALHPLINRALRNLICGSSLTSDYRLIADRHPDLPRVSDGKVYQRERSANRLAVALSVACAGGLESGQFESALREAMAEHKLSRATVAKIWSEFRDFFAECQDNDGRPFWRRPD